MLRQLFSVFDKKAERFFPPFPSDNVATACRSFLQLLKDPQSVLAQHPEDYVLYRVGDYDERSGDLVRLDRDVHVVEQGVALIGRPADVVEAEQVGRERKAVWENQLRAHEMVR